MTEPLPPEGPRTKAGRRLARHIFTATEAHCEADILAIEREAASPAPLDVERLRWFEARLTEALNADPFVSDPIWILRGDLRRWIARLGEPSE